MIESEKLNKEKFIKIDAYKRAIDYSNQEDMLINQRLTQTLTLNGFMFAAYALIFQNTLTMIEKYIGSLKCLECTKSYISYLNAEPLNHMIEFSFLALVVFCFVGIITSITLCLSILSAQMAGIGIKNLLDGAYQLERQDIYMEKQAILNFNSTEKIYYYRTEDGEMLPSIFGGGFEHGERRGVFFSFSIPCTILIAWGILLVISIYSCYKYTYAPIIIS